MHLCMMPPTTPGNALEMPRSSTRRTAGALVSDASLSRMARSRSLVERHNREPTLKHPAQQGRPLHILRSRWFAIHILDLS